MALIPDATQLQRRNPSGQQAVVQMDTSNADLGLKSFGSSLAEVGRDLKQVQLVERQAVLDEADLAMEIANSKTRAEAEENPDWANAEATATKQIEDSIAEAAQGIDERDREGWITRQRQRALQSQEHVRRAARVKERDHERAVLDEQTQGAREAALNSDDPGAVVAQYDRRLESQVARGNITEQERQKMLTEFENVTALDRLERMDPAELTEALKDPELIERLPPDERLRLEKKAEVELVRNEAIRIVDEIPQDATRREAQATIDQIEDEDLRIAAETRYNSEYAANEAARVEAQVTAYEAAALEIEEGAGYESIPRDTLHQLTATQRGNLRALDEAKAVPVKVSDPATYDAATTYAAQGDWNGLKLHLANFGSNLNTTDRKKFFDAAAEGMAPSDVTVQQLIAGQLPGDKDAEKQGRIQLLPRIKQFVDQHKQTYGKEPTTAEIEKEIQRRMKPVINPDGGYNLWWDADKPVYQVEDQERRAAALDSIHAKELHARYGADTYSRGHAEYVKNGGGNRFNLEKAIRNQSYIDDVRARNVPAIQSVVADVDQMFLDQGREPTQEEWINAVTKIASMRNAPEP